MWVWYWVEEFTLCSVMPYNSQCPVPFSTGEMFTCGNISLNFDCQITTVYDAIHQRSREKAHYLLPDMMQQYRWTRVDTKDVGKMHTCVISKFLKPNNTENKQKPQKSLAWVTFVLDIAKKLSFSDQTCWHHTIFYLPDFDLHLVFSILNLHPKP